VDVAGPIDPLDIRGFEAALTPVRSLAVADDSGDTDADVADLIAQLDQARDEWLQYVTPESDPADAGAVDLVTVDLQAAADDAAVRPPASDSPAAGEFAGYLDVRNDKLLNELPIGTKVVLPGEGLYKLPGDYGDDGSGGGHEA
jgi:hypothetical protein